MWHVLPHMFEFKRDALCVIPLPPLLSSPLLSSPLLSSPLLSSPLLSSPLLSPSALEDNAHGYEKPMSFFPFPFLFIFYFLSPTNVEFAGLLLMGDAYPTARHHHHLAMTRDANVPPRHCVVHPHWTQVAMRRAPTRLPRHLAVRHRDATSPPLASPITDKRSPPRLTQGPQLPSLAHPTPRTPALHAPAVRLPALRAPTLRAPAPCAALPHD